MNQVNNKPAAVTDTPKHYFLAAGYVHFHPVGKPDQVESTFLNGVFANETGVVSASDLSNGQRVLMQQLQSRASVSGGPVEIIDVAFTAISRLGEMTPTQFHGSEPAKADA